MNGGVKSRTTGSVLHGTGLKAKYRSYPPDDAHRGRPIKGKK